MNLARANPFEVDVEFLALAVILYLASRIAPQTAVAAPQSQVVAAAPPNPLLSQPRAWQPVPPVKVDPYNTGAPVKAPDPVYTPQKVYVTQETAKPVLVEQTQVLTNAAKAAVMPLATQEAAKAVGTAVVIAGDTVQTGIFNPLQPSNTQPQIVSSNPDIQALYVSSGGTFQSPSLRQSVGSTLQSIGGDVAGLGALPATFGSKLLGLAGQSKDQQVATFGQASVQTVKLGLNAIPVVGGAVSQLFGLGAGTYEGQRAVKAVGVAEENAYSLQKDLFSGDFSGGGSSHFERVIRAAELQDAQARAVQASVEAIPMSPQARQQAANTANYAAAFTASAEGRREAAQEINPVATTWSPNAWSQYQAGQAQTDANNAKSIALGQSTVTPDYTPAATPAGPDPNAIARAQSLGIPLWMIPGYVG